MIAQTTLILTEPIVAQFTGDFLWLALVFLLLAVFAGLAGQQGVAGVSMQVAKWLVILFIVLFIVSLLL